jgi:hypothetical protein
MARPMVSPDLPVLAEASGDLDRLQALVAQRQGAAAEAAGALVAAQAADAAERIAAIRAQRPLAARGQDGPGAALRRRARSRRIRSGGLRGTGRAGRRGPLSPGAAGTCPSRRSGGGRSASA